MPQQEYTPTGPAQTRFENRFVRLDETPVLTPAGGAGSYVTIQSGTGFGGLAVPRAAARGVAYYGLVRQHRFPIGAVTLEFPRGGTADLSFGEAARELVEELACTVVGRPAQIGTITPDTGILSTQVSAWLFTVNPGEDALYREDESGATHLWVNESRMNGLIAAGQITCGFTLAAWALLLASGRNVIPQL